MNQPDQIITLDLMKLTGADVVKTKTGAWAYVLNLNLSHAQVLRGLQMDRTPQVIFQFRAHRSPNLHNEQTHLITESISRERYAQGSRSLIIGTARSFE